MFVVPGHAEALEELRMHTSSGRADRLWSRPFAEGIESIFGNAVLPLALWSQLDWYGPLETWRKPEAEVSDILFNGPAHDPIFVMQRGAMTNTGVTLHPSWVTFIQRQLLLRAHKLDPLKLDPFADLVLPDRDYGVADDLRYAITTFPFSRGGPTLAIRMLPERWRTLDDMVQSNTISRDAATLILTGLREGASVMVAGSTGSGKTTLAAGFTQELGKTARMIYVEDGGELPRTANSVHLEASSEGNAFAEAVRFTLRQKPSYVVVGEVRGGEAMAMLQAATTGHPGICTIHANDVQSALRNLERNAMLGLAAQAGGGGNASAALVRGLITTSGLLVVHIGPSPRGRRTVLAVDEVLRQTGQGASGDAFPTEKLFTYDPHLDGLQRVGTVNAPWGHGRY
ncbi:MAG: CpaF family protein [Candidatus Viridilinea halotolerans]|uniref:CpaF family protein n=1 Tax=Candidatus Viridilinea halotolerans TaxID=2491704 RepID=A0A426U2A9_9CHLR|nr:MAG: CpaF family protein [Candidatus Viridilinea halotolerans]